MLHGAEIASWMRKGHMIMYSIVIVMILSRQNLLLATSFRSEKSGVIYA